MKIARHAIVNGRMVKTKNLFSLKAAPIFKGEKIRFAAVGMINTIVDFTVLLALGVGLRVPTIPANIVSTSCALVVSYLLNKKAVFKNDGKSGDRQFASFIIVTLVGLWIMQPIIIIMVTGLPFINGLDQAWSLAIGKVIATIATLVWNYIWYSRVIFKGTQT